CSRRARPPRACSYSASSNRADSVVERPRSGTGAAACFWVLLRGGCVRYARRQPQREAGADAGAALHRDVAAEQTCDAPADGEPESGTWRSLRVGTPELLEEVLELIRGNARAGVADVDEHVRLVGAYAHDDAATCVGVFDRVRDQVAEDLADAVDVTD